MNTFLPASYGPPTTVANPTPAIPIKFALVDADGLRARVDLHIDGGEVYTDAFDRVDIDWGDGTVLQVQPPFDLGHDYQAPGVYSIWAIATRAAGGRSSSGRRIQISGALPAGPAARYTFTPDRPAVDELVTFDASRSTAGAAGAIDTYEWDFRDGTTDVGPTVTHAFASADSGDPAVDGAYAVQLVVTDTAANADQVDHYVQVEAPAP